MASTTALYTGLSGLNANARRLDVVGNNIANVNTIAYKTSRIMFESAITNNLSIGAPPGDVTGGTNPGQIGLGVNISGTQRDFSTGSLEATGDPRDLAIEGEGFFMVDRGDEVFYTRNGAFRQNELDELTTINGERLLGLGVDANFNLIQGDLVPITVPLGQLRIAEQTTRLGFTGNLNAGGDAAVGASLSQLLSQAAGGFAMIPTAATPTFSAASLLTQIEDPLTTAGSGTPLFTAGESLRFEGIERGGQTMPTFDVPITATTTVGEVMTAINAGLGIDTSVTNPDGSTPGARVNAAGYLEVVGNTGTISTITIDPSDIQTLDATGALARLPFAPVNAQPSTGESVRTATVVFDSLGNPVDVGLGFTLVEKSGTGTTWRYEVTSPVDTSGGPLLASGTVRFDTLGRILDTNPIAVSLDRDGSGAATPLTFNLELAGTSGEITALTDQPSEAVASFRNGLPAGTLEQFAVDPEGLVLGTFNNGAVRTLGRVMLARFANPEGVEDVGAGLFRVGANSGQPTIVSPGELATGRVLGGTLELSNVDLSQEFINLILTSTGYSASSRVIRTSDELIQQLLVLGR